MARKQREGATKRTFRLSNDLMTLMAQIAERENRTLTAQIEVFLWDRARQYEREKQESVPGNNLEMDEAA
jgi:hypothetical protein